MVLKEEEADMTRFRKVYTVAEGKREYAYFPIPYGWATTQNPEDAKIFDLENRSEKAQHDYIINNFNGVSEETTENGGWMKVEKVETPVKQTPVKEETRTVRRAEDQQKYRIETTDGRVVRKVATRPYHKALIWRKGESVHSGPMTTGNFNRRTLDWYLENGFTVEQVIAKEI